MKKVCILFFVFVLSACGGKKLKNIPEDIIERDKMVDILTDIHLSDAVLTTKKYQTSKHEYQIQGYYTYLYEKHGYTRAEIDSSIAFYSKYPNAYSELYDDVLEKLSTIQSYYEKTDSAR